MQEKITFINFIYFNQLENIKKTTALKLWNEYHNFCYICYTLGNSGNRKTARKNI